MQLKFHIIKICLLDKRYNNVLEISVVIMTMLVFMTGWMVVGHPAIIMNDKNRSVGRFAQSISTKQGII